MDTFVRTISADTVVKLLALVGASVAFVVGLFQYRKAQRWKRAEWIAEEMQSFFSDARVLAALRMIDWGARRIELYPDREDPATRSVYVRDDELAKALENHEQRPTGFSEDEATIRDVFDHFLDRLERINSFVETHLVRIEDLRPYLRYWARHINAAREGDPSVDRLYNYVDTWRSTVMRACRSCFEGSSRKVVRSRICRSAGRMRPHAEGATRLLPRRKKVPLWRAEFHTAGWRQQRSRLLRGICSIGFHQQNRHLGAAAFEANRAGNR
ncbi:MAG TPA: hypothetical protein VFN10_22330 [Thermoanaerobaculia bacterium]|nr:hypothetical protein [Thermoanaerobaculia bacterium]